MGQKQLLELDFPQTNISLTSVAIIIALVKSPLANDQWSTATTT
jgi:hypothetical protein